MRSDPQGMAQQVGLCRNAAPSNWRRTRARRSPQFEVIDDVLGINIGSAVADNRCGWGGARQVARKGVGAGETVSKQADVAELVLL